MSDPLIRKPDDPQPEVAPLSELCAGELEDLCDATIAAIEAGGGFGWIHVPPRDVLERYWQGVLAMPARRVIAARLDGVICGTCQLVKPPANNEAQAHAVHLTTHFIAPWARGYHLDEMIVHEAETAARDDGFSVINTDVRETLSETIALYERLGFEKIGTHPAYAVVDGEVLKGYHYYKSLTPL